jgi:putative peptide zinc metalloprotease protein
LVSDPVSLNHFLFSEYEYQLALNLKRFRSVEELSEHMAKTKVPGPSDVASIRRFVGRLVADNLVVVPAAGYGRALLQKQTRLNLQSRFQWLKNPLAIRLRGVTPAWALERLVNLTGWLFHPMAMAIVCSVAVLFFVGGMASLDLIHRRMPSMAAMANPWAIGSLLVAVAGIKVLHELGHAVAAHRNGAKCKEIGLMFLVGMPTLYCDVTDAWSVPSRWQRVMISFAGIYVELMIAMVAAGLWLVAPAGPLNTFLFQIVSLCGISTLLINGNPLLKYDGYYMLSDAFECPNLRQAADGQWRRCFSPTRESINGWLVLYSVCAKLYRWSVVTAILAGIVCLAIHWSVVLLGWLACGFLLAGMIMKQRKQVAQRRLSASPIRFEQVGYWAGTLVVVAVICWVPFPRSVFVPLQVQAERSQTLFAQNDGVVSPSDLASGWVEAGTTIATIRSDDLAFEVRQLEIAADRANHQVEQLLKQASENEKIAGQIAVAKKIASHKHAQLIQRTAELERLNLTSELSGNVQSLLAGRNPASKRSVVFVKQGTPIARVLVAERKIHVQIDEERVDQVAAGQQVTFSFDRNPEKVCVGSVQQILAGRPDETSANVSSEGSRSFYAVLETDDIPSGVEVMATGRAKIAAAPATIAQRVSELIGRTFRYQ